MPLHAIGRGSRRDANFATLTNLPSVNATELYELTPGRNPPGPALRQLVEEIAAGRLPMAIGLEMVRRIADPQRSHDLAVVPRNGPAERDIAGRYASIEFVRLVKQIASAEQLPRLRELYRTAATGLGGC